jgi:uncharacterized alkaline shock family protein YloU
VAEVPRAESGDGGVTIADGVVIKVAVEALKGVEGIGALGGGSGGVLSSLMGDKGTSGISVDVREGSVDIDVSMAVKYGFHVPSVAEQSRAAVKEKVEATTGFAVRAVNVLVTDIVFPEENPA